MFFIFLNFLKMIFCSIDNYSLTKNKNDLNQTIKVPLTFFSSPPLKLLLNIPFKASFKVNVKVSFEVNFEVHFKDPFQSPFKLTFKVDFEVLVNCSFRFAFYYFRGTFFKFLFKVIHEVSV